MELEKDKIYISVVMPVYNGAIFLKDSIPSVLDQTLPADNYEIIIVDDASTDNGDTRQAITELGKTYPSRIIPVFSDINRKQGGGRNLGITHTRGDYVTFLDADDYYLPYTLAHLLEAALTVSADLVEFDIMYQTPEEKDSAVIQKPSDLSEISAYDIVTTEQRRNFVFNKGIGNITNKLYKTSIIRENNIRFSEKVFYEEPSFIYPFKLCTQRYCRLNEALYVYVKNPASVCNALVYDVKAKYDNMSAWIQSYAWFAPSEFFQDFYREIELLYLKWFLFTSIEFAIIKYRFINESELAYLQDFINEHFPNYADNPYIGIFIDFTYENDEGAFTINLLDLCMLPLSVQNISIVEFNKRFLSYLAQA